MRSRILLVTLAAVAVGLLASFAPNPPTPPTPPTVPDAVPPKLLSDSLFTDIDLDAIPDRPFARFRLKMPRDRGESYCSLRGETGLVFSADLRRMVAEIGNEWERVWDALSATRTPDQRVPKRRTPYTKNYHCSADGRVSTHATFSRGGLSTSSLVAPHLPAEGVPLLSDWKHLSIWPLAVSPDGRWLYLADEREVRVWDTDTVQPVRTLCPLMSRGGYDLQGVEVIPSPDGRRVAVFIDERLDATVPLVGGCGMDFTLPYRPNGGPKRGLIFETATWATTHEFRSDAREARWWVGGDCLASQVSLTEREGERVHLTELRHLNGGGVERHSFTITASHDVYHHSLNSERRWEVAWGNGRSTAGRIRLSDLFDGRRSRELPVSGEIDRIAFTPDTRVLIVLHTDDTVSLYDLCGFTKPPADYTASRLWADLISEDAVTVYRAARWATEHPAEAVKLLQREAEGRAVVPAERVRGWVADLGSGEFAVRHAAMRNLSEHLAEARPALETAAAHPANAEAESRLADLLARPDPVTAEGRRSRWAVFVLDQIRSPEATAVLARWAEGKHPFGLTAEAKAVK